MAFHDLFSSGAVAISQRHDSGTFAPGAVGGTGNPVFAGNHAYHAAVFIGTLSGANACGSMILYGHTASTGDGTTAIGTLAMTAGTGAVVYDIKADQLLTAGTAYTHLSAQVIIPTGSVDCRGALFIMSYGPRTAGTTPSAAGIRTLGTAYA